MTYRLPAALIPLALLAGCGEEPVAEPTDNDGRTAAGEVIGGTISDSMLPLDTVRSQSPPAVVASGTASGDPSDAEAVPAGGSDEAADAEPAADADEAEPEDEAEADEDDA